MKMTEWWVSSALLSLALACGSDKTSDRDDTDAASDEDLHESGIDTGATCPSDSKLTYATFGRAFMSEYCNGCHASTLTGIERTGAPDDHNFESLELIQAMSEHIDHVAAGGPDAVNEMMPVGEPKPTLTERKQLGEWLACGAP